MILKNFSDCDHALQFFPLKIWPDVLPAIAWRGHCVVGFSRSSGWVLNLESEPLHRILLAVYGSLNVFELARLYTLPLASKEELDFAALCRDSGLNWCEHLRETLVAVARLPVDFQHWCEGKSMSPKDVQIFKNFSDTTMFWPVFDFLMTSFATRQQSVEILELHGELLLLGMDSAELLPLPDAKSENHCMRLKALRHPLNQKVLQERNSRLDRVPWPKSTQGRWSRQGDRLQLEVKVTAPTPMDLQKRLSELQGLDIFR